MEISIPGKTVLRLLFADPEYERYRQKYCCRLDWPRPLLESRRWTGPSYHPHVWPEPTASSYCATHHTKSWHPTDRSQPLPQVRWRVWIHSSVFLVVSLLNMLFLERKVWSFFTVYFLQNLFPRVELTKSQNWIWLCSFHLWVASHESQRLYYMKTYQNSRPSNGCQAVCPIVQGSVSIQRFC